MYWRTFPDVDAYPGPKLAVQVVGEEAFEHGKTGQALRFWILPGFGLGPGVIRLAVERTPEFTGAAGVEDVGLSLEVRDEVHRFLAAKTG